MARSPEVTIAFAMEKEVTGPRFAAMASDTFSNDGHPARTTGQQEGTLHHIQHDQDLILAALGLTPLRGTTIPPEIDSQFYQRLATGEKPLLNGDDDDDAYVLVIGADPKSSKIRQMRGTRYKVTLIVFACSDRLLSDEAPLDNEGNGPSEPGQP
ncbi:hypothetical protein VTO42DRAFT_4253 [Malbranchea cinnamomea]